jgi:DTW domain-containing protein YfiP
MHVGLCVCEYIPRLNTTTHLVVLSHVKEQHKPSNTTHFLLKALSNSERWRRGGLGDPLVVLPASPPAVLLFPFDDAVPLQTSGPVTLVVPDGTWQQARRMARREPALQALPHVTLPPGLPSQYRVRTQHRSDGLSTFEAVTRALGILEGPHIEEPLLRLFEAIVAHMGKDPGLVSAAAADDT